MLKLNDKPLHIFLRLWKYLYWVLPVVLLTIIFSRIDFAKLRSMTSHLNPWLFGAGLLTYPLISLVGVWRWQVLLCSYLSRRIPFGFAARHYYVGLVIGFFSPASAGCDVYRVIAVGRQYGQYRMNIAAVLSEKFVALLSAGLLVVILYPLIRGDITIHSAWMSIILRSACVGLLLCGFVFTIAILLTRHKATEALNRWIQTITGKIFSRFRETPSGEQPTPLKLQDFLRPLIRLRSLVTIIALSIAISAISAAGGVILFMAIGCHVPFLVNLFVVPIMLFIFILPISFGSVGVREGAHILLYGLFGVSQETALVMSFMGLTGLLFIQAIGTVIMWWSGARTSSKAPDNP